MRQDERAPFVEALERARVAAFAPGEFVGQESFMRASEIRALARRAAITSESAVLDLCCGIAGPGRLIAAEFACGYLGVDLSPSAIAIARELAGDLPCRFEVSQIPPLPAGRFDVVLLLETMLAFADKETLVRAVAAALPAGGRFAFTVEEGSPLTVDEAEAMPDADTVWLVPREELHALLTRCGFDVISEHDASASHRATAESLVASFAADEAAIAGQIGQRALDELIAAHRLWIDWLASGRVRKLVVVAEAR